MRSLRNPSTSLALGIAGPFAFPRAPAPNAENKPARHDDPQHRLPGIPVIKAQALRPSEHGSGQNP